MGKTERIIALDAFRGITIAAMIMVNQPGSWSYKYGQMKHAEWHGCTLTDLIFPFFLFIVGLAMWFAFGKHKHKLSLAAGRSILRRTVLIFLVGLFLNLSFQLIKTGGIDLPHLRITGVLQRIALCYGLGALLCLGLKPKALFLTSIGILLGYWILLRGFGGSDPYAAESCVIARIDTLLLGKNHLRPGYPVDASGFVGSIPGITQVIWGYLVGRMIALNKDRRDLVLNMFLTGIPAVLLAKIWNYALPINKTLWTGSYVLYTTGWALITLAFFIWIIDINKKNKWISPLLVFGANPLFAYVFAELWGSMMANLKVIPADGHMISVKSWLFNEALAPVAGNMNGSLLYSVFIMVFYWAILWILYKKKIFIKI